MTDPVARSSEERFRELRERALSLLTGDRASVEELSSDGRALIEEMQILWTELELQGDELRRSQQAAEEARAHYFRIFEEAPIGFVLLDAGESVVELNRKGLQLFGIAERRVQATPFSRFVGAESVEIWRGAWARVQSHGSSLGQELSMRRVGGQRFMARVRLVSWSGRTPGVMAVVTDITEQRQAEERQRDAVLRLRALFDGSRDGILLVDPVTHTVSDANPAMSALLGCSTTALVGRPVEQLFSSERTLAQGLRLRRAREDGKPVGEIEWRSPRGGTVVTEVMVSPVRTPTGTTDQYVVRDTSERRRLMDALTQAQKMDALGLLASGVAHDMNNVLSVVMHAAGALGRERLSGEGGEALGELLEATHRARDLVSTLLTFTRRTPAHRRTFDLREAVGEVVRMLRRTLPANIALEVRLPPQALPVDGDPSQWHQAILNLGVNARDAMARGGKLTVEGTVDEHLVTLLVSDTGVGMNDETRRRAFEPFFTTKPLGAGTGLGLSIVYNVVTAHGGRVEVDSALGRGTTFRLVVPRAVAPASGEALADVPAEAVGTVPAWRLLVVDDEDLVARGAVRVLRQAGLQVESAGSGASALELLASKGPFDVVLCDAMMPGLDGGEVARRILADFPSSRVVIMSGNLDARERQRLTSLGVRWFLDKPFSADDVLRLLGGMQRERATAPRASAEPAQPSKPAQPNEHAQPNEPNRDP